MSVLLHELATQYAAVGRDEEAEPLLQTSLELRRETLDQHDLSLASSLIELADLHIRLARYDAAEGLLQEARTRRAR